MSNDKPKIYKANNELAKKIGTGPLNPTTIERAQRDIENNKINFSPLGLDFLTQLESALENLNTSDHIDNQKKTLIAPVMELKANAKIFHYELVGNLANIMLNFLETIKELDNDALSIVRGHHDSLKVILANEMKGDGGTDGSIMVTELTDACNRYYKKKK